MYDNNQKWLQIFLKWVLPIFGALLVLSFAQDAKSKRMTTNLNSQVGLDDGVIRLDYYFNEFAEVGGGRSSDKQ